MSLTPSVLGWPPLAGYYCFLLPSSNPNQWYFAQRLHTKFKQCKGIIIELIHFSFIFPAFPSNLISVPLL
ncbi:hypothetical protein V6Z11_D05G077900 [Gossypium hirsutum]